MTPEYKDRCVMAKLKLIRGLPGSGKSTLAKTFIPQGYVHLEADMYFMVNGEYQFKLEHVYSAHKWCQNTCRRLLDSGQNVVVANTFIKRWEFEPYLNMNASDVEIIVCSGRYGSIHNVSMDDFERMSSTWEEICV